MTRRISVVIPTIDEPDELRECFACLSEQTHDIFDILVIDSGSGINQQVVDNFSNRLNIRMLSIPKNGLPRARNIALTNLEKAEIVAFCDPDARPVPVWLEALASEYDDGVGAVGGPVLRPDETIQSCEETGIIRTNGEVVGNFHHNSRELVQHLRGTNMSFDIDILQELGGFDPAYRGTAHFEDTDATYKIYQAGYDIIYTPDAKLEHHHPREERDLSDYHYYRITNWPVLFEKTNPSFLDRVEFHGRRLARAGYYKLERWWRADDG